jgi:hypothetical protein
MEYPLLKQADVAKLCAPERRKYPNDEESRNRYGLWMAHEKAEIKEYPAFAKKFPSA